MSDPGNVRPLPDATQERYDLQARAYRDQLDERGMTYLTGRGLTEATIRSFGLGYVDEPIDGEDSRYRGMVSIPYIGPNKRIYGIKFRAIDPEQRPKMDGPHGQRSRLFNTRALETAGHLIACAEGEFDAMILNQIGVPAVGCPGASVWPPFYHRIFAGFSRVIFTADNDDQGDGRKWAQKAAGSCYAGEWRLMPEGHDVNSLFVESGADAVLEALRVNVISL
jgi:DNA primase